MIYTATTSDIEVAVRPVYLEGQSQPAERRFAFAYFVTIHNRGREPVQLLRRHWYIFNGETDEEVEGEGVVGQQPRLRPGASHEYNSFCVIRTFEGHMSGTYTMLRPDGSTFDIAIPRFTLRAAAN